MLLRDFNQHQFVPTKPNLQEKTKNLKTLQQRLSIYCLMPSGNIIAKSFFALRLMKQADAYKEHFNSL